MIYAAMFIAGLITGAIKVTWVFTSSRQDSHDRAWMEGYRAGLEHADNELKWNDND